MKFRLSLLIAIFAVALTVPTSASGFGPYTTNITTPANGALLLTDTTAPAPITISGTSTGIPDGGQVAIYCFNRDGADFTSVASGLTVTGGAFSGTSSVNVGPCKLRAFLHGHRPPIADMSPYTGPIVFYNRYKPLFSGAVQTEYEADFHQSKGGFKYSQASRCGIELSGYFYGDGTGVVNSLYCNQFFAKDMRDSSKWSLRVDGNNAYSPDYVGSLTVLFGNYVPPMSTTYSVDPASGNVTINEEESMLYCADTPDPVDLIGCTAWSPAGVMLKRTISQSKQGRQAIVSDSFVATDGNQHTVDVGYEQDFREYGTPRYNLAGTVYSSPADGTDVAGPFANNSQLRFDDPAASVEVHASVAMNPGADSLRFKTGGQAMMYYANRSVSTGNPLTIEGTYRHGLSTSELDELAAEPAAPSPAPTTSPATIIDSSKPGAKYEKKSKSVIVSTGKTVSCPAGGGVCTVTGSLAVKYKKGGKSKTLKLMPTFSSVTPGSTQPLTFSMKIKNNPLFKPAKKAWSPLYGSLSFSGQATATASGAPAAQGSLAFKLKLPKIRR